MKGKVEFLEKFLTWKKNFIYRPIYKGNLIIHLATMYN
jgi:hypothetical protein